MSKVKKDLDRLIELCKKHGISISTFVPGYAAFQSVRKHIFKHPNPWKLEEYSEKMEMYSLLEKHFPGDTEEQWKFVCKQKGHLREDNVQSKKRKNIFHFLINLFKRPKSKNQEYGQYTKSYR
jgi:hypothetical protein